MDQKTPGLVALLGVQIPRSALWQRWGRGLCTALSARAALELLPWPTGFPKQPSRLALREWMRGRVTTEKMAVDLGFTPVYITYIRTGRRKVSDSFKRRFATR